MTEDRGQGGNRRMKGEFEVSSDGRGTAYARFFGHNLRLFQLASFVFYLFSVLCFLSSVFYASNGQWQELKGDHFIIYHKGTDSFASEVLRKSESYYNQISSDLGYARYSNFWQWDNRVKIYIYPSQEAYLEATGGVKWSHGLADYDKKEIHSYERKEGFLDAMLPHEMTHLIFRDYVGFKGGIPLWLDEGVAQWEEPAKRAVARQVMKYLIANGRVYTMKELTETDVRGITDTSEVANFYVQAVSVIDFLVEEIGASEFITFCRQLRDGKSFEEALTFAYPTSMRTLSELEEKWKRYILEAPDLEGTIQFG